MAVASARVVVLMQPDEKERITMAARHCGVSVGEFMRRSAAERMSDADLETALEHRDAELELLLDELEASSERAHAALDSALAAFESRPRQRHRARAERVAS
jgi:uncharacterized protein (DUF1778 family)